MRVRIPSDASFLAGGSPEQFLSYVDAEGDGPIVAYALVKEQDGELVADHVAGRFPKVDGFDKDFVGRSDCLGRQCQLKAGEYWLYLVSSGPARVTIRLQGLSGHTQLVATERVPVQIVDEQKASFDVGRTPGVRSRSLGATRALNAPGLVLAYGYGDWTTPLPNSGMDEATVVADYGLCEYGSEPSEGYVPFCGTSGTVRVRQFSSRQDSNGGYSQTGFFPRFTGKIGFGAYQTSIGQVDRFGLAGVWLQFQPS